MALAPVAIRAAVAADAAAACECVRRSITALCVDDHGHDPALLARWLANKTAQNFAAWIDAPEQHAVVAQRDGTVVGFGLARLADPVDPAPATIALLYVDPAARFAGASDALLRALEHAARAHGRSRIDLVSTATAQRFYAARGYRPAGASMPGFGRAPSQPMTKTLD